MSNFIKISLILFLGIFSMNTLSASTPDDGKYRIVFQQPRTFDGLLQLAKSQNRPIFIDFYADWCIPCKRMEKQVLGHEGVAAYMNMHFINVKLNTQHSLGRELSKKYNIRFLPTVLFISPKGEVILKKASSLGVVEFMQLAQNASYKFDTNHRYVASSAPVQRTYTPARTYYRPVARQTAPSPWKLAR